MGENKSPSNNWKSFKILMNLALVAFAVILAVTAYNRMSDTARVIAVGSFCSLGVIVTAVMLVILVRQSHGKD